MAVAGDAVHVAHLDVGGMRKEDTVGLARIDQPGYLAILGNILLNKDTFILAFAQLLLMAVNTLRQLGNTGVTAVVSKKMTALTAILHLFIVQCMVEIKRLFF